MDFLFVILQEPLQKTAVIAIAAVLLLALIGINTKNKTLSSISSHAPNLLTSFGIFFTFLGIFIALVHFDVDNINTAVPKLLNGLKLAFLSSVVGLFCAILFRVIQPTFKKSDIYEDATASDLLIELKELNNNTIQVKEALIGDGESSLSTQFGKLRNDFRDFAQKVSEDGSKSLIEALESVIKDFNEKISEQFGENFKELNKAVGGLLDWQQEYKEQVTRLTEAFQETQKGIKSVQESVEKIEQSTQQIPVQMDSVQTAFNSTEDRMKQLYEGLHSLSEMQQQAKDAVPFIQKQINEMTNGLKESIEQQVLTIEKEIESMKTVQTNSQTVIKDLTDGLSKLMSDSLQNTESMYTKQMEKFQGVLDSLNIGADNVLESTKKVGQEVENIIQDFAKDQREISNDIKRKMDESLSDNVETMNKSFQALDKGMQEQLQRSLDKMGNNLSAITDQFVETYEQSASRIINITSKISKT